MPGGASPLRCTARNAASALVNWTTSGPSWVCRMCPGRVTGPGSSPTGCSTCGASTRRCVPRWCATPAGDRRSRRTCPATTGTSGRHRTSTTPGRSSCTTTSSSTACPTCRSSGSTRGTSRTRRTPSRRPRTRSPPGGVTGWPRGRRPPTAPARSPAGSPATPPERSPSPRPGPRGPVPPRDRRARRPPVRRNPPRRPRALR